MGAKTATPMAEPTNSESTETNIPEVRLAASEPAPQTRAQTVERNFDIQPEVQETPLNVILKLEDKDRGGEFNLPCEDLVVDPKTKNLRRARLLRNVGTIWQDEQKDLDAKWCEKNIRTIQFSNKNCIVPIEDRTMIEFINVCNFNLDNPNRTGTKKFYFHVWNPLAEAKKEHEKELQLINAMQYAATAPFDKMKRHALFLGVPLANEMGQIKKESELRVSYMQKAKQDPERFTKSSENPVVDISWAIRTLISNGQLDTTKQAGQVYWNNGGYITSIPAGEDTRTYLERYALVDGEENRNFKSQLLSLVK